MTSETRGGRSRDLPEHAVLGPYRLVRRLGEGGMGVVHLALDPQGRAVAIKVLRPHIAHDPLARDRLAREVATLSRIRDPRVASVLDADIDGPQPYIVTEYVPGTPLDDTIRHDGPLDGHELHRLGSGLASAITAIHAAGVIHRDVKPGNVLLVDGDPVLIDFGIAHVADDVRLTMTGLVMGTPGYLAPEVFEGGQVTRATDWWGWAATLAFSASGHPPYGRGPMEAVLGRVACGDADLSGVDPSLAPVLAAALSPDPEIRPDAAEIVDALQRYAVGAPPAARFTQTIPQQVPRTRALPVGNGSDGSSDGVAPAWSHEDEVPDDRDFADIDVAPGDPRIGRPMRSGTLAAILAVLTAGAAVVPVVAAAVFVVGQVVARTVDRSLTSLILRRHARGVRRSDVSVAVLASPWHFLTGVVATVFGLLVPAGVGVAGVYATALGLSLWRGGPADVYAAVPLAAGAFLALVVTWWGLGGASIRRGARSTLRAVLPDQLSTQVAVVVLCIGALALAVWSWRGGAPVWWPLTNPPTLP